MASENAIAPRRTRRTLLIGIGVLLIAVAIIWTDAKLTRAAHNGFVPAATHWTASSANFPAFLSSAAATPEYRRARASVALPPENLALDIRKAAGIRPTAARWRVWLGSRAAIAKSDDGIGVCVRPGAMLRVLSAVGIAPRGNEPRQRQRYWYAWRDGFLIVSESPEYVRACLDDDAVSVPQTSEGAALTVARNLEPRATITVQAREGFPCRGRIDLQFTPPGTALSLANAWPQTPIVGIAGGDPREVLNVVLDLAEDLPLLEHVRFAIEQMKQELPEGWATGGAEYAFALAGIDESEDLPIPELALMLRGNTAGVLPEMPEAALPFEWNGAPGWLRPWLGSKLSIGVSAWGGTRTIATQERLMPRYVRQLVDAPAVNADMALQIDWTQLGPAIDRLLLKAARNELLPRMNERDVEQHLSPYVRMLEPVGVCRMRGIVRDDELWFEGALAGE